MIELRHVYKAFGSRQILRDVNLSIEDGETMVILGASGSGKSTVLKLIIGLIRPDAGEVLVDGKDMALLSEEELNEARRQMGMVFQYSALFDSLNIKENVAFGLRMHRRLPEADIDHIVAEKLRMVGLSDIETLMPSALSGGMKKRVSLARAIALNPTIILYDEPTAGLDPIMSTSISLLIRRMQKEMHATSVVVTHEMASAKLVADRMAFLHEGSFLTVGTPEEIYGSSDRRVLQFVNGWETPEGPLKEGELS